jgi:hypothetical protein
MATVQVWRVVLIRRTNGKVASQMRTMCDAISTVNAVVREKKESGNSEKMRKIELEKVV